MNEHLPKSQENTPPQFTALCGRVFRATDPRYFPQAEYRGRIVYFCNGSCLEAFLADPDLFYAVHRPKAQQSA